MRETAAEKALEAVSFKVADEKREEERKGEREQAAAADATRTDRFAPERWPAERTRKEVAQLLTNGWKWRRGGLREWNEAGIYEFSC